MYCVFELLRMKGPRVHTTTPDATVLEAAQAMNRHKIGALVVVDPGIAGIISERDILTRVVAAERAPSRTRVADVMTREVITCGPGDRLDDLRRLMRERRVRHIPVVEGGRLAGLVSMGDVNAAETRTLTETIGYLEAYITH